MSKNHVVMQLENKVQAVVSLIQKLKKANKEVVKDYTLLQEKLSEYESRITQLEDLISTAEEEQHVLERSVLSALSNLDDVDVAPTTGTTNVSPSHSKRDLNEIIEENNEDEIFDSFSDSDENAELSDEQQSQQAEMEIF